MNQLSFADELRQIPFLRLVIFLLVGIILEIFILNISILIWTPIFIVLIILLLLSLRYTKTYRLSRYWSILLLLTLIVLGCYRTSQLEFQNNEVIKFQNCEWFIGIVDETPIDKENFKKIILQTEYIYHESQWKKIKMIVNCRLNNGSENISLKAGNRLLVGSKLSIPSKTKNPQQFDYKKYLYYKKIVLTSNIDSSGFKIISKGSKKLKYLLYTFREYLLEKYKKSGINQQEFAVLSALVWGFTGNLDPETYNSYSKTGAMHILSVSGLHVGIVYIGIGLIFSLFDRKKKHPAIKAIVVIVIISLYSIITGMSSPVIRSAFMLTIVEIGRALDRKSTSFNSLMVSAFLLLVYNPFYIMDIGFQLSYIALLGILVFNQPIESLLKPQNSILNLIWKLVAVSVAAQISTFPMCLFYFHQFPNYFLIANLIVTPVSFIILFMGMLFPLFYIIPLIDGYYSYFLDLCLWFMNQSLLFIERLPGSTIENVNLSTSGTIILYIILSLAFGFIVYKKPAIAILCLIFLLIISSIRLKRSIDNLNYKSLIVYDTRNEPVAEFIGSTRQLYLVRQPNATNYDFNIKNHHIYRGVISDQKLNVHTTEILQNPVYHYHNLRVVCLVNNWLKKYQPSQKLKVDILIVSNQAAYDINLIINHFDISQIVFDSSVKGKTLAQVENICKRLKIKYHSVSESGYYEMKISN